MEQLDVVLAATSASLAHSSGDKGKPKPGASSAPSDRAKSKQNGGGFRAAGSGKGRNSGSKGGAGKPNMSRDGSTKPSVSAVAADGGNDDSVVTLMDQVNIFAYSVSLPQPGLKSIKIVSG